jgi:anaerobic selenocysteine-containing dehydrogenase
MIVPDGQAQGQPKIAAKQTETLKNVICTTCDGFCPVAAKVEDGRVVKITTRDHPLLKDVLCMKGAFAPKQFSHPDRILYPLKRVGARGENKWERVSWDAAMDDIALRLKKVVTRYGAEALAARVSVGACRQDHRLRCSDDRQGGARVRDQRAGLHPLDASHRSTGFQHLGDPPAMHARRNASGAPAMPIWSAVVSYSSTLKNLGFDPLPYYREAAEPDEEFPLSSFVGLPDNEYFRTGQRHIPELRQMAEDPMFFMNRHDSDALSIVDNEWVRLKTKAGAMLGRVYVRSGMPKGLVRVPHGWWKPESRQGGDHMSGLWSFGDAQLTAADDPELIDLEQGVPHLKGTPCSVTKLTVAEIKALEAEYGATNALPRGPEGKVLRSDARPNDFMWDDKVGDGIEFEAAELSTYGRYTI